VFRHSGNRRSWLFVLFSNLGARFPTAGLSVRDYLDGREGKYKQMLKMTGALNKLKYGVSEKTRR
jgi:hypothetical protein